MNSFVVKIVAAGALLGGATLFAQYDRSTNYEPVEARITHVTEKCYLKKVSRGFKSTKTTTTGEGDCSAATMLAHSHPEYQGMDVIRTAYVEVKYRSPADGKYHRETMKFESKSTSKYRSGQALKILAHVSKADRIRKS